MAIRPYNNKLLSDGPLGVGLPSRCRASSSEQADGDATPYRVLQFVLFVRACVEVDRRKKDRRIQKLVLALQRRGRDPSELPLSTYALARQTSFPKDMLDQDLPLPLSPVQGPAHPVKAALAEPNISPDANAKYDADAMQRARELDIRESQKVLIDPRVEGAIRR